MPPPERHRAGRIGWLRAAVLGANDGIVSTASLVVGVAAAHAPLADVLLAGVAGVVAGAMSMAAGEYVSVSSQADTQRAELELEQAELSANVEVERRELETIYVRRGLTPDLARQVAAQLMAHDALAAHARDELGITSLSTPQPVQAALFSAGAFSVGGTLALVPVLFASPALFVPVEVGASLALLAALGAVSARVGGASAAVGAARITFWGALAMGLTAAVGAAFGTVG